MSFKAKLTSVTPREAIADALYRAVSGFDRNDVKILRTAFTDDASFELLNTGNNVVIKGYDEIRTKVFANVGPMDTTHVISNVRVDVEDGAKTASMTAYSTAQHCPPGTGKVPDGPQFLGAGEASLDLVRDDADGLWKIEKWVMRIMWHRGDPSVLSGFTH